MASAFPPHYYRQEQIAAALRLHWADGLDSPQAFDRLLSRVGIDGRFLSLPLEEYDRLSGWGDANNHWIEVAEELGQQALCRALSRAGLTTDNLGALFFTSVTGIASPSIDARLINRLGLPRNIKRVPIFGLGCVGGAAGVARAADYVRAYPDQVAALLSVELCSLTWQRGDTSVANIIASGLFGDGAAAALINGSNCETLGPEIIATRSSFYPGTQEVMGWDISEKGFQIVLSPDVPKVIQCYLAKDVDEFLADHDLTRAEIGTWIMHTGGPKVLEATAAALNLPENALDVSWRCLRKLGNLSSASVLLVLEEFLHHRRPASGMYGIMAAMGPGFCAELLLLRW